MVGPSTPICPGAATTIWSNLIDLSPSTNYAIKLSTANYCPGIYADVTGNDCWVTAPSTVSQDCNSICAYYGLVPALNASSQCYNDAFTDSSVNNCQLIRNLKGSACTSCTMGASYNYYDSGGDCWETNSTAWTSCSAITGFNRACQCNADNTDNNTFYFPFATPATF